MRLKHFLSQWQILTQHPTILNIVQGYRLQFHTQPTQTVKPVGTVSKKNISILNAEISKLLLKGTIRSVNFTNAAFYSRVFLVPKKGGDLRPVIDSSALNQFVINQYFQMENISCRKQILNQNDFMVKLDLKDAYLTVGVHEQSQHYLRFIWQGQPYQFQALHRSKGVHQTSKTCHNIPSDTQYSSHLFGRYSHSGFRYKNMKRTNRSGFRSFAKPGVYDKLREICTDSFARHGVSRTSSRLQNYDVLPTVTQGDKNNRTMQCPASKQNRLAARARPVIGVSRVNTASSMAGSASLQTSSLLSDTTASPEKRFLRRPRMSPITSKEVTMKWWISNIHQVNGWQSNTPSILRADHNVRRIKAGLRCCTRSSDNTGSWSSQGRSLHINILELKAAFLAIQSFLKHKIKYTIYSEIFSIAQ